MTEQQLLNTRLSIAGIFKRRRESLGITQAALAAKCGVHERTIRNIETAAFSPTLKQILVLMEALDMPSLEELLTSHHAPD